MTFWTAQTGPHWDGDARGDGSERCIGEIVCPRCQGTIARLLEGPQGVGLRAWMPGQSVVDPGGRSAGFEFFTPVTKTQPADLEVADLSCWRGHGDLYVDGEVCRSVVQKYRARGRIQRHAATQRTPLV